MRASLIFYFTIAFFTLQAQINGKVIDEQTGAPLPYATISLFLAADSLLVDGTITDEPGTFSLETKPGSYFIKVEFLAYEPFIIEKIEVKNAPIELGSIKLAASSTTLQEVVVQAEKSTMQMSLDKRIFNVGKDLGNAGGNAAELLSNIPSVQVDVEGNVSLRGSGNVRILIDGKPSGLVSFNGAAGLQQLQGSLIERVEIITNPSARYEAEGVGGIINIILKKERRNGFNGSFDLTTGIPANYGVALNLNYRHDRFNFFVNYGVSYRKSPGGGSLYQRYISGDTTFFYRQKNNRDREEYGQNARAGLDFYLNASSILTASYTLRRSISNRTMNIDYKNFAFTEDNLTDIYTRTQVEKEVEPNSEYSLNYKKTFDDNGHEFTAEARVLDYWEDSDQDFTEKYFLSDGSPSGQADLLQNSYNYEKERQFLFQADYVHPISKEGKIEGGLRGSLRELSNDYEVTQFNDGDWETLPGLKNNFIYNENIYAAYGIFGDKKGKFSYQFGLRVELTDLKTELLETNEANARDYKNLFPSAHLTYDLPNDNAVQVSYSRRVRRPRYRDLSPFVTYSDDRNYWSGNPDLSPEYTDAYELGHIKYFEQGSLSSSMYYRHTTGKIERIRRVDEAGNAATRPENLSTEDAFGLEFTAAYDLTKWWKIDGNFNFFRSITDGGNLGASFQADAYNWFTRFTTRFTFWKNTDLQLRGNYEAKEQTTQGYRKPNWFLDLAMSQDILKKNATLTLNIRDLFNTRRHQHVSEGATFYTESDWQWRRRQVNLTFSYRLHQQKKKGGGMEEGGDF
ncbi:MAG: TonB-dependent receptor [Saprospiraceae bacterium]|nr:TonB-dependent receptor [Saprospiraceae bacterium]MCF8250404.1 TonB-dependent receptor [Saprospiraceae bacterium]MCF8312221.1 TonB-dependent receptor [Saprospiraceae bacterium]MCF8440562.1 TonB-dependent receptor [Saprospiraceae bacterium]